jgi:hypothetical protein
MKTTHNGQRLVLTTNDSPKVPLVYKLLNSPPASPLVVYDNVSVADSFYMYLMYQYDKNCIWIPIGKLDWNWGAKTNKLKLTSVSTPIDKSNVDKVLFGLPCNTMPEWNTNTRIEVQRFNNTYKLRGD